jgi:hypothetical protein
MFVPFFFPFLFIKSYGITVVDESPGLPGLGVGDEVVDRSGSGVVVVVVVDPPPPSSSSSSHSIQQPQSGSHGPKHEKSTSPGHSTIHAPSDQYTDEAGVKDATPSTQSWQQPSGSSQSPIEALPSEPQQVFGNSLEVPSGIAQHVID